MEKSDRNWAKDWPPMLYAALEGRRGAMEVMLRQGANPNIQGSAGMTALHVAALNNDQKTADLLMSFGADPTIGDIDGLLPMDYKPSLQRSLELYTRDWLKKSPKESPAKKKSKKKR